MKGIVFNIQRFCTDDGPGIRTTVFLKGCNMSCFLCHNPESLELKPQIQFFESLCIGCGICAALCPMHAQDFTGKKTGFRRECCRGCGLCAEKCPAGALVAAGSEMDTAQVMAEIGRDAQFYENSGGGVTFSGGEPLLQRDFLKEILVCCRERGYHTALESALNVPWEAVEDLRGCVSLFLADVKLIDEERHRAATGGSNRRILENITRLARGGSEIIVRIPIIPSVNANAADMAAIADFVRGTGGIRAVELMPYHAMAQEKYTSLGRVYAGAALAPPSDECMQEIAELFRARGLNVL
ncbi:MAG: glycyl-radical enzyme activating protein [Clostridia bacterium]|nr:glycyl-radical enzyme activating protein [Clostridia bacterium]